MIFSSISLGIGAGVSYPVDGFEDGNTDEYSPASGNSGSSFKVTSKTVLKGEYAGKLDLKTGTLDGFKASEATGLKNTPASGNKFHVWVRAANDHGSMRFEFAGGDYGIRLDYKNPCCSGSNKFYAITSSSSSSVPFNPSPNTWYKMVGNWSSNGDLTAKLYDTEGNRLAETTATGSQTGRGSIALYYGWYNENGHAFFDGDLVSNEPDICDYRGPFGDCISNKTHQISGRTFNLNSVFLAEPLASFNALDSRANIEISNNTYLSGFWTGRFNITSEKTIIKPGASFRPENGNILIN